MLEEKKMPHTPIEKFGIVYRDKSYKNDKSVASPKWINSAIIYEVYLRSYSKDGDIVSFIKKLPELKELGINTICLMPVYLIGHLKRKGPLGSPFAIRDYYRINPEFGKKEDVKNLVKECHNLGIRVILDFVANHAANDHIEKKNHPEWFKTDDKGNYVRSVPGWSDVIDLNYENKDLRQYIKDVAIHWVKEYDIDGYRCDVAGLVPMDFWVDFRKSLQKTKKDILLLAEWEDPEMNLKAFDITYDWVLYFQLDEIFNGTSAAQDALDTLFEREANFPKDAVRLRFLENHDQARATYKFGNPAFKAVAAFIFTISGVPFIYNGQEVGDPKHLTLFDKNAINWKIKGANEIRKYYKTLIDLRTQNALFRDGKTTKLENSKPRQIVSFSRTLKNQKAMVFLNFSDKDCPFTLKTEMKHNKWKVLNIATMEETEVELDKWKFKLKAHDGNIYIAV